MDKNDRKIRRVSWGAAIGCFCATFFFAFMMWLTTDSFEKSFSVAALCGGMVGVVAIAIAVDLTLKQYHERSKKAFRALGKHGITVVMRDKNARVCYKGIMALMNGKLAKAEKLLMQALNSADIVENQLFCVEWLGQIYDLIGDRSKLLWTYRRSAELVPDRSDLQCRLGQFYFAEGNLDNAYYCFEQAKKYNPNEGYPYYSIAKIHMVRGEYDKAHEMFGQLLKINEAHPLAYAELAVLSAMENDAEKAKEYSAKALVCGHKEPEKLNARITAILQIGQAREYSISDLPNEYYGNKFQSKTNEEGDSGA